jgi:hypothetical protein
MLKHVHSRHQKLPFVEPFAVYQALFARCLRDSKIRAKKSTINILNNDFLAGLFCVQIIVCLQDGSTRPGLCRAARVARRAILVGQLGQTTPMRRADNLSVPPS